MIQGLLNQGVEVYECHARLWESVEDRVRIASGGWLRPRFWKRVLGSYRRLLRNYRRVPDYDIMLVGYPGQFDVYLARLLSWWRRKPLVLDILMSLHLIADERGLTEMSPVSGRLIFWLEKWGLKLPDLLISDTPQYTEYYSEKYDIPLDRFRRVPLGVDDRIYYPRPDTQPVKDELRVIYYGTFIPLHGIETMIEAAALLRDRPHIQFHFYGDGQERSKAEHLANQLALDNVHFHGWVSKRRLPKLISLSHIVLGVFGTSIQSRYTVQNKIWEGMIMKRPVITGEAETVRAELTHKKHVYLVERANPAALAKAIVALEEDPQLRTTMAEQAYQRVQTQTIAGTGATIKKHLLALIGKAYDDE